MGNGEFADRPPRSTRPQPASRELSVLVGSDDPFTRHAFRTGAKGPGITVLGAGTLASVSEDMAFELEPDAVVLDVQTTAADALAAIQKIRVHAPSTRVLACSAPAGDEFGLLCLSAGAWGYVSKEIDLDLLPRLLHALVQGEAVIPRTLATELVRRLARSTPARRQSPAPLTSPECRLLESLRTGHTLREAAAGLGITLATARRHFGSARRKLATHPPTTRWASRGPSSSHRINSPEVS